ncbi:MAG TPA: nitroreductase/quinone reductase family protein [Acidimicrobiia bacterium]|nr:nitroreductase/quinone reductase family protein [Acidimicrobiia bacterium]
MLAGPWIPESRRRWREGASPTITTTGRKTGLSRRVEIYFHQFDGDYYLTGRPGFKRDWEANIKANPDFTLHLKRGFTADVPVVGETEPDPEERAAIIFRALTESWGSEPEKARANLDYYVNTAPFIRFRLV